MPVDLCLLVCYFACIDTYGTCVVVNSNIEQSLGDATLNHDHGGPTRVRLSTYSVDDPMRLFCSGENRNPCPFCASHGDARTISRRQRARTVRSPAPPARPAAPARCAAGTLPGAGRGTATCPSSCAPIGARKGRRTSCLGCLWRGRGEFAPVFCSILFFDRDKGGLLLAICHTTLLWVLALSTCRENLHLSCWISDLSFPPSARSQDWFAPSH